MKLLSRALFLDLVMAGPNCVNNARFWAENSAAVQ